MGWITDLNSWIAPAAQQAALGNQVATIFSIISGGLNLANKVDKLWSSGGGGGSGSGYTTGTVSLDMTGALNLDGYISGATSHNFHSVNFTFNDNFKDTVQGVWSLQSDPVLYLANDTLVLANTDKSWGLSRGDYEQNYRYSDILDGKEYWDYSQYNYKAAGKTSILTEFTAINPRIITFIDPRSLKINLNTAIYKDISNVTVSWALGVYSKQSVGYTNQYRTALGLPKVGDLRIAAKDDWMNTNLVLGNNHTLIHSVKLSRQELLASNLEEGEDKCTLYNQDMGISSKGRYDIGGIKNYLYGRKLDDGSNPFLVDPQVGLPYG